MNNPQAQKERNDKRKEQIVVLYKAGNSYREIAKVLEISHEWVRKLHLSTTVNRRELTEPQENNSMDPR